MEYIRGILNNFWRLTGATMVEWWRWLVGQGPGRAPKTLCRGAKRKGRRERNENTERG